MATKTIKPSATRKVETKAITTAQPRGKTKAMVNAKSREASAVRAAQMEPIASANGLPRRSPTTQALMEAGYLKGIPLNDPEHKGKEHKPGQRPILEIINLRKEFGTGKRKKVAVDNISFNVYENENLALLGANGAGKTTTVEIVAGISKPTSGQIKYNYPYKRSFHEGLGIQFQDSSYPEGLSCRNVVEFMLETYLVEMKPGELENMIEIFGVKEFYKKAAKSLSGGQQQRLNILLSLLHKPRIVFLDELSTGLDIKVRSEIKSFIRKYCDQHNITIVLVSHDMTEVEELCNRVVIMQGGKIVEDSMISDIVAKYGRVETLAQKYI